MLRWRRSYPAVPSVAGAIRSDVAAIARECGLGEDQVADVKLAVSEAAANAVIHAYRNERSQIEGTVTAEAYVLDDELRIVIADDGAGMAPRTDSPGLGLGLPLIATLALRVDVVSEGAGTELHIVFPRPASAAA
jgi:anti-sigma regulatory factor (Ser/Thr protein kinase)